ncbi:hypothetical protein FIBSPDRAFT_1048392, partial [Athelia psychrophila]
MILKLSIEASGLSLAMEQAWDGGVSLDQAARAENKPRKQAGRAGQGKAGQDMGRARAGQGQGMGRAGYITAYPSLARSARMRDTRTRAIAVPPQPRRTSQLARRACGPDARPHGCSIATRSRPNRAIAVSRRSCFILDNHYTGFNNAGEEGDGLGGYTIKETSELGGTRCRSELDFPPPTYPPHYNQPNHVAGHPRSRDVENALNRVLARATRSHRPPTPSHPTSDPHAFSKDVGVL